MIYVMNKFADFICGIVIIEETKILRILLKS